MLLRRVVQVGGLFVHMSKDRDKADKLIALALDPAAEDGEWRAAACAYFAIFRKRGYTAKDYFGESAEPEPRGEEVMTFGRYKGQLLVAIPTGYLQWLMTKADGVSDALRNRISYELSRRSKM